MPKRKRSVDPIEKSFIEEAQENPEVYLIYADWLDEQGRKLDAAKAREKADVSKVLYQIWMKDPEQPDNPRAGPEFRSLSAARGYITNTLKWDAHKYKRDARAEYTNDHYEIRVYEYRQQLLEVLPAVKEGKKK